MDYNDYVHILTAKGFTRGELNIPASTFAFLERNNMFSIQDYLPNNTKVLNIFGAVKARIYFHLKRIGFTLTKLCSIKKQFESDLLSARRMSLSTDKYIDTSFLVEPIMIALAGERYYVLVDHEGDIEVLNEEELVERISLGKAIGVSVDGNIVIDIKKTIGDLGIKVFKGRGFLRKIGRILELNDLRPKMEYYTHIRQVGESFLQVLKKPNTKLIATSNNKGSITSIHIYRKNKSGKSTR